MSNQEQAANMLTTAEVAARLNISHDTALRIMKDTPGVFRFKNGARTRYRIPEATFNAFVVRKSSQTRRPQ